MDLIILVKIDKLIDRIPHPAQANGLDLVIVKYDNNYSILYGR